MPISRIIDSFIGFFSPSAELSRVSARHALASFLVKKRGFSVSASSKAFSSYINGSSSGDSFTRGSLAVLRDFSRDLTLQNPYAAKALEVIVTNTVGTGIAPNFSGDLTKKRKKDIDAFWNAWAESLDCSVTGGMNFYSLQTLAMRCIVESGEVLIRRVWNNGLSRHPFQLQILEPDHLDSVRDTYSPAADGSYISQGIEYDANGRRLAYWLMPGHPGDSRDIAGATSVRVPAEDIIHAFEVTRPGQGRGYPWCSAAIDRLLNLNEFEKAQLVKQKVSACFAAFIRQTGSPINAGPLKEDDSQNRHEVLEPGSFQYLQPNEDVTFPSPPRVDDFVGFSAQQIRAISCAYRIPYESIANDLSNVNFSSGRMGWLDFQRSIQGWQQSIAIPLCQRIFGWFKEYAAISGVSYDRVSLQWIVPARSMINPKEETDVMIKQRRAGLATLEDQITALGGDYQHTIERLAQENNDLDAAGLILDSDPRMVSAQGIAQQSNLGQGI